VRSNKINYLLVGTFVLAMIAGLIVALSVLTGRTGATDAYHAYYSNVTGVKFGTQVVYEGYPIGQVETVTPEPSKGGMRFRVDFEITEGWKIPKDSKVAIAAPGLLAAVTLSISAGASPDALAPGAEVTAVEGGDLFAVVSGVAEKLGGLSDNSIEPLLASVHRAVNNANKLLDNHGEALAGDLKQMINEASLLVADVSRRIPVVIDNMELIASDVKSFSGELKTAATPENRRLVEETVANLNGATKDARAAMANGDKLMTTLTDMVGKNDGDLRRAIKDARYVVESVARRIDAINENLEGMSRNMLEFSRQIRQSPGLLLNSKPVTDEVQAK
jgi:phospholipid/cholesterol/gamma-HCH transport system substrate-binding protein